VVYDVPVSEILLDFAVGKPHRRGDLVQSLKGYRRPVADSENAPDAFADVGRSAGQRKRQRLLLAVAGKLCKIRYVLLPGDLFVIVPSVVDLPCDFFILHGEIENLDDVFDVTESKADVAAACDGGQSSRHLIEQIMDPRFAACADDISRSDHRYG